MSDHKRIFKVERPTFTEEDLLKLPYSTEAKHLELYYNVIMSDTPDIKFPDHLRPITLALADTKIDKLMVLISPGAGKALADDMPVLTNSGWKVIGSLTLEDQVYAPDGNLTELEGVYPQGVQKVYTVTFEDGKSLEVSGDHLWNLCTRHTYSKEPPKWEVIDTHYVRNVVQHKWTKYFIPITAPVTQEPRHLPIHPYLMGVLLGAGIFGSGEIKNLVEVKRVDSYLTTKVTTYLDALGLEFRNFNQYVVSHKVVCKKYEAVKNSGILTKILTELKLFNTSAFKHFIPEMYKLASISQRVDLVKGLLDTIGKYVKSADKVAFITNAEQLVRDIQEILWSLGTKAFIKKFTRFNKIYYRLIIDNKDLEKRFGLQKSLRSPKLDHDKLRVVSVVESGEKSCTCIRVKHPSHQFIAKDYIVTHNSQLMCVVYPSWRLGLDPSTSILAVSSAEGLVLTFMQAVMNIIEHSPIYKELFPGTKPDKETGWSVQRGIYIKRAGLGLAPPSFTVAGYESRTIVGKHAKELLGDDVHDDQNSATQAGKDKVEDWYYRTFLGRQDPGGSRLTLVGRRWAEDDLYGRLRKSGDWLVMELAAFSDSNELGYNVRIPAGMACVFNDYIALPVVEDIRVVYGESLNKFYWVGSTAKYKEAAEVRKNKPDIFEVLYQGHPERASSVIFRREDFSYFKHPEELSFGRFNDAVTSFVKVFDFIIQSWDTSYGSSERSDPSVCYTLGLKYCEEYHRGMLEDFVPAHYDVYVLDEFVGQIDYAQLLDEAVANYNKWAPEKVLIEKAVAGIPLIGAFQQYHIPVIPVTVQGTSKRSRAIDGAKAGSAQGWFRQGRVLFPEGALFLEGMELELLAFTGGQRGVDDRVDSLIQGINYAIDLGTNSRELGPDWKEDPVARSRAQNPYQPTNIIDVIYDISRNRNNPFNGMCATCYFFDTKKLNYCKYHKQTVSAMHSCPMFSPIDREDTTFIQMVR